MCYYRTHNGTESNLVLVGGNQPISCIEIKFTASPRLSKGFQIAIEDLQTEDNFVVVPRSETYRLSKNVEVYSLADFLVRLGDLKIKQALLLLHFRT